MSNLQTRVLVAVVGIPLILFFTMTGGVLFFVLAAALSGIALHEYYALATAKGAHPMVVPGIALGLVVNLIFFYAKAEYAIVAWFDARGTAVPSPTMAQALLIVLLVGLPAMMTVELFRHRGSALMNLAATLFGVLYVSLALGAVIGLRELFVPADFPVSSFFDVHGPSVPAEVEAAIYRWGGMTVMAMFASIWICDSAAYFAGRAFGRHKLFERVSPHKTWEGAIAGCAGGVLAFVAAQALVLPYMTVGQAVVCGAIVGVFGQLGDLAESLLKRDAGAKDSSNLIPGHGGALDRFDSLLFVAPLLYVYLDFIVF